MNKIYRFILIIATVFVFGSSVQTVFADNGTLTVTKIVPVQTSGISGGGFANGWKYDFYVTVPSDETVVNMKFNNWTNGIDTIPANGNIRLYSAQSLNATTESSAITLTGSDIYSAPIVVATDTDLSTPGNQIVVSVEVKIPTGVFGGSYSTNYGIQSNPPIASDISFDSNSLTQQYDGTAKTVSITTTPVSLASSTNIIYRDSQGNNLPVSNPLPVDAGTYTAVATITDLNYVLTSTSATFTITPAPLVVTASGTSKVYDGTNVATTAVNMSVASGAFGSDTFSVNGTATFDGTQKSDYNVGTAIPVTVTGITIQALNSTTNINNYFCNPTATTTANITPRTLNVTVHGDPSKVYDATTTATVYLDSDKIPTDQLTATAGTANFASADVTTVASGTVITIDGITIANSGIDWQNYVLATTTMTTTADITPLQITVTGLTAQDKPYDGTTAATATGTAGLTGVLGTDNVTPTGTPTFAFADKNVGTSKPVSVSGYTLTGNQAFDYTLATTTLTASINPMPVNETATNSGKSYDGTNDATSSTTCSVANSILTGDTVACVVDSAQFSDVNTGTSTVTILTSHLTGADAINYSIANDGTATTTGFISPQIITTFDSIPIIDGGTVASPTYPDRTSALNGLLALYPTVTANHGAITIPVNSWIELDSINNPYNPTNTARQDFVANLGAIPSNFSNPNNYSAAATILINP